MKKNPNILLLILSILILIDQLSKFLVRAFLIEPQRLIGDFLILEKSQNTGIAFGLKINQNLILLGTIILLFFVLKIVKKELDTTKKLSQASILLILAGAVSNFMDRLMVGSVTDFISFNFWPSFNLADVFIVAGVLMIVVFYKKIKNYKYKI